MSDLRLEFNNNGELDLVLKNNDIAIDGGLTTPIFLSLSIENKLDNSPAWWGGSIDKELNGIRELPKRGGRENISTTRLNIEEAMEWLITEGVADSVDVSIIKTEPNRTYFEIYVKEKKSKNSIIRRFWIGTNESILNAERN